MPHALVPGSSGCRRVWAARGCGSWALARWRRGRDGPGARPRAMIPCARCRRCHGPRGSGLRHARPSGAAHTPGSRSGERQRKARPPAWRKVMSAPCPWTWRWRGRARGGRSDAWGDAQGARRRRPRWRFEPGWPQRRRRSRPCTSAAANALQRGRRDARRRTRLSSAKASRTACGGALSHTVRRVRCEPPASGRLR
jgi:hypothetical protein